MQKKLLIFDVKNINFILSGHNTVSINKIFIGSVPNLSRGNQ
jgi:hypothetical protein